jgi:hypothetical protein
MIIQHKRFHERLIALFILFTSNETVVVSKNFVQSLNQSR